jgi:hypothetical protein
VTDLSPHPGPLRIGEGDKRRGGRLPKQTEDNIGAIRAGLEPDLTEPDRMEFARMYLFFHTDFILSYRLAGCILVIVADSLTGSAERSERTHKILLMKGYFKLIVSSLIVLNTISGLRDLQD